MFNFSCTACLTYTGNHVPDSVDAKVTMQVDLSFGRANFISKEFNKANTYTYNVTLHRGTNWCKDLMVQNKQRASGRTQPLILAMIYELANDPIKDTTGKSNY
ncbi:hypothetical protein L798_12482 [Zootermopsis nevadensis]|uniref:Uncharacterized protein n=1 Tax=Zootermopsis nevadensis TaxID=136037 RepID=A0A067R5J4_ZOONE|nr:hypothetical protein L798_12482 [Zootermopsis nevadensis]